MTDTASIPDLLFYTRSVDLSSYAGQSIYVGFQHDANDQDRFFLDDILILDKAATNIESHTYSEALTIYPNPSEGLFTIKFSKVLTRSLAVYNMIGETVFESEFSSEMTTIDLSNLPAGIYTLKSTSTDGSVAVKEIVIIK